MDKNVNNIQVSVFHSNLFHQEYSYGRNGVNQQYSKIDVYSVISTQVSRFGMLGKSLWRLYTLFIYKIWQSPNRFMHEPTRLPRALACVIKLLVQSRHPVVKYRTIVTWFSPFQCTWGGWRIILQKMVTKLPGHQGSDICVLQRLLLQSSYKHLYTEYRKSPNRNRHFN